jgi:hypothetical protein
MNMRKHSNGAPFGSTPLNVARDTITGGVSLRVGDRVFVMSPDMAVRVALSIFRAAGGWVEVGDDGAVVRPPPGGLAS